MGKGGVSSAICDPCTLPLTPLARTSRPNRRFKLCGAELRQRSDVQGVKLLDIPLEVLDP